MAIRKTPSSAPRALRPRATLFNHFVMGGALIGVVALTPTVDTNYPFQDFAIPGAIIGVCVGVFLAVRNVMEFVEDRKRRKTIPKDLPDVVDAGTASPTTDR